METKFKGRTGEEQGAFILDTDGQCFICVNIVQAAPSKKQKSASDNQKTTLTICSFQSVSQYLNINLAEAVKGLVPLHLLPTVQKSNLKVPLCQVCGLIVTKFSKRWELLKKSEMEMQEYLREIRGRMGSGDDLSLMQQVEEKVDLNALDFYRKLEIAEAIRKETRGKCSMKLQTCMPIVKLVRVDEREKVDKKAVSMKPVFAQGAISTTVVAQNQSSSSGSQTNFQPSTKFQPIYSKKGGVNDVSTVLQDSAIVAATTTVTVKREPDSYTEHAGAKIDKGRKFGESKFIMFTSKRQIQTSTPILSQTAPGAIPSICEVCKKKFPSRTKLHSHMRLVHNLDNRGIPIQKNDEQPSSGKKEEGVFCPNCQKTFKEILHLRQHQKSAVHCNKRKGATTSSGTSHNRNESQENPTSKKRRRRHINVQLASSLNRK